MRDALRGHRSNNVCVALETVMCLRVCVSVCECAYINTYDRNTEPERERQSGKMEMVEKKESKAESKTKAVTAI